MQWASEPLNESKFHLIVRRALGVAKGGRNALIYRKSFIRHDNYFSASINLTRLFACVATSHTCLPECRGETEENQGCHDVINAPFTCCTD